MSNRGHMARAGVQAAARRFLFLQGPPGPFFFELAQALDRAGAQVARINFSGGDHYDWPGKATAFRGRMAGWPTFFDRFARDHAITDLVLFGDCRPMHRVALRMAKLRGIHVHVYEEGYIRPDWMTLERDGVNGHSPFERDPDIIAANARWLPSIPKLPPITADFRRRARDSYWHYHHVVTGRLGFPFYTTHRPNSIIGEGLGWLLKFARARARALAAEAALSRIEGQRYFLFPLQLSSDYQIRHHSPFGSMAVALDYVMDSFAHHAPQDAMLLIKEHPLDCSFRDWGKHVARRARRLGIGSRVIHIAGGELGALAEHTAGMVCVNSTSGTLGLEAGCPVVVLGDAIYDVTGITHQSGLDKFWAAPEAPDAPLYEAFKRSLHAKCLVRGGLASESAVRILVEISVARLLAETKIATHHEVSLSGASAAIHNANAQGDGSSPESSR